MKKKLKKHVVRLTSEERHYLSKLVSKEEVSLKKKTHARILLKANAGEGGENCTDEEIRKSENISLETVKRIRRFYVIGGLEKLRLCIPEEVVSTPTRIAGPSLPIKTEQNLSQLL